jgi:hypothetical protein
MEQFWSRDMSHTPLNENAGSYQLDDALIEDLARSVFEERVPKHGQVLKLRDRERVREALARNPRISNWDQLKEALKAESGDQPSANGIAGPEEL